MPTLKSPQSFTTSSHTTKKQWPKYTRISLNTRLQETIAQIQRELPLFSTNDVLNFLISKGYQHWLDEHPQYAQPVSSASANPVATSLDEDENLYSTTDGEAIQFG